MRRACVIALLPLLFASARADDKPDLQTILDAWKAREKKVESFDFRWRSKRFEDGATNSARQRAKSLRGDEEFHLPDTTYIAKYRFVMDDRERIRMDHDDNEWSLDKEDYVPRTSVLIYDGTNEKRLFKGGGNGITGAFIGGDHRDSIGKLLWLFPVTMTFRPLTGASAVFDEKKLALSQNSADSEGNGLIVLNTENSEVAVDPTKDYVPVRLVEKFQGNISCRMTISHRHDPVDGWIPQSWTINLLNPNGKPYTSESATVVEHSINKAATDSEFDLDLSGGAYVQDHTNGQRYILRADGQHRPAPSGQNDAHAFEESIREALNSK